MSVSCLVTPGPAFALHIRSMILPTWLHMIVTFSASFTQAASSALHSLLTLTVHRASASLSGALVQVQANGWRD